MKATRNLLGGLVNKKLKKAKETAAKILGKRKWTKKDREDLKKVYQEMYKLEAQRRLVIFHDSKDHFKPRILAMNAGEVAEALLVLKPAIPTVAEWVKIYGETENFLKDEKTEETPPQVNTSAGKARAKLLREPRSQRTSRRRRQGLLLREPVKMKRSQNPGGRGRQAAEEQGQRANWR